MRPVPRGDANFGVGRVQGDGLRLDGASGSNAPSGDLFGSGPDSQRGREIFNALAKQVFTDPYAWIDDQQDRLGTVYVSDEEVALTWDDRPILPPFGLTLRLCDDGQWRLRLPTSFPFIRQVMPRNENEYMVFGMILKTIDNLVVDLTADLRGGEIHNLTDLADTAVEKAALPAIMIFVAYSNLVESRGENEPDDESRDAPEDAEAEPEPQPEPQPEPAETPA